MAARFPALFGAFLLVLALAWPAAAQELSDGDRKAIRDVIGRQVEAFRRDDGDAAFSLASPDVQRLFGTSETFMTMVRNGYRPVYRPRVFEFGDIVEFNGQLAQKVRVVGPDGRRVTAIYPMMRLPDGSWRIDGCFLQAPEEHQV
jgi:hypothetical protein